MNFQTFGGVPTDNVQLTVGAVVKTLNQTKYTYTLVQFQEVIVGEFAEPSRIARYIVNGELPTLTSGFIAGEGDTRIFTRGELEKGVKLFSAEAGKSFIAVVQYFKN